jgi:conjugal transfer pilus assembly protein TraF
MRARIAFFSLLTVLASPVAAEDEAMDASNRIELHEESTSRIYWRRSREGWFWYQEPADAPKAAPSAPPIDAHRKALHEFEAMQKRLDELKRVAVMNPTDANLLAYMRHQRLVMNKSEAFAERWQRLVWSTPDLDYAVTGRPTNAMAIGVFDEQRQARQDLVVRKLAQTHGLLFVFRSDCPYCHRFAPILKRFEQEYGMSVLAVTLDGGVLPEYPHAQPENGAGRQLNVSAVPALYLMEPSKRDIRPVGFGLMAFTELVERIATLGQDVHANPL